MIRSIELDLVTRSEANQRFASRAGMMAKSGRVKEQRGAVRAVLATHLGAHVPPIHVLDANVMRPNRIEVRLVRIAVAELDDDNLRGALKAVRDAVAKDWIGIDDRDPIATWHYGQEKAAAHVYRVRIEIEDLAPGEPRRVVLAETASEGRAATARVKREVKAMTKKRAGEVVQTGRVLSYQPDAAARGASSAARGKAEAAFPKLTGRAVPLPGQGRGTVVQEALTALDLRDAAERVLVKPKHAMAGDPWCRCPACGFCAPVSKMQDGRGMLECRKCGSRKGVTPYHPTPAEHERGHTVQRDPGDEARPEALTDCETCGVRIHVPCVRQGTERMVYGVHVARARAAGLTVPADDRAAVKPARTSEHWTDHAIRHVDGVLARADRAKARRLATVPGQARLVARRCYVALPWEQPRCEACEGRGASIGVDAGALATTCGTCEGRGYRVAKLTREQRLEGVDVDRPEARYKVPLAERARWGSWVTLHRTERTIAAHGVCWVYVLDDKQANR